MDEVGEQPELIGMCNMRTISQTRADGRLVDVNVLPLPRRAECALDRCGRVLSCGELRYPETRVTIKGAGGALLVRPCILRRYLSDYSSP